MTRYRQNYSRDPRWMTARFPGVCAKNGCDQPIGRGDRIFYYPNGKAAYAEPCGHADANSHDFEACAFDEDVMGG